MGLTFRGKLGALGAISALFIAMAFGFQAAGYAPCELCILQRWPHVVAALIGLAGMAMPHRGLAWAGAAVMLISAALGLYHSGVEWGLWAGPSACTGGAGNIAAMNPEDLLNQIMQSEVVRCDEPALKVLGTTMANWNALASAGLAGLWAWVAVARQA